MKEHIAEISIADDPLPYRKFVTRFEILQWSIETYRTVIYFRRRTKKTKRRALKFVHFFFQN